MGYLNVGKPADNRQFTLFPLCVLFVIMSVPEKQATVVCWESCVCAVYRSGSWRGSDHMLHSISFNLRLSFQLNKPTALTSSNIIESCLKKRIKLACWPGCSKPSWAGGDEYPSLLQGRLTQELILKIYFYIAHKSQMLAGLSVFWPVWNGYWRGLYMKKCIIWNVN